MLIQTSLFTCRYQNTELLEGENIGNMTFLLTLHMFICLFQKLEQDTNDFNITQVRVPK